MKRASEVGVPHSATELIEFVGPHCDRLQMADDPEDTRITLSVHDLRSAFDMWGFYEALPPIRERIERAHRLLVDIMHNLGLGDGNKGWIQHDEDGKSVRDTLSLEGELCMWGEVIHDVLAQQKADALDAERYRFRKLFLADGGAILWSSNGCQFRKANGFVTHGATEEEALDLAMAKTKEEESAA